MIFFQIPLVIKDIEQVSASICKFFIEYCDLFFSCKQEAKAILMCPAFRV